MFYEPLASWDVDGNLEPDPRRRNSLDPERRPGRRRQIGDLEAQARRQMARRQTVHRRRRGVQLGIRHAIPPPRRSPSALHATSRSKRSTTSPSASCSRTDAVLGQCLCRRLWLHHPKTSVCRLHGRQVPRSPEQSQASRHRALQVRRVQAWRHGPRRAQSRLPHGQPALFRYDRNEGRRRCGLGGPRRHPDRRVRLRLEHAGRGRGAAAPGKRRQGQDRLCGGWRYRVHRSQLHRSQHRGRRRAILDQDQASGVIRPAVRKALALLVDRDADSEGHLRPRRTHHRELPQRTRDNLSPRTRLGVQHRKGSQAAGRGRLEDRAPTASAKRTERS